MMIKTTISNAVNMANLAGKETITIKSPYRNYFIYVSIVIAGYELDENLDFLANEPCTVYMENEPNYAIIAQVCENDNSRKALEILADYIDSKEKFAYENGYSTHPKNAKRYDNV